MSSVVTIKIGYDDKSHSYTESFVCADTSPSPEVIMELEQEMREKYWNMNHRGSGISLHTVVNDKGID